MLAKLAVLTIGKRRKVIGSLFYKPEYKNIRKTNIPQKALLFLWQQNPQKISVNNKLLWTISS